MTFQYFSTGINPFKNFKTYELKDEYEFQNGNIIRKSITQLVKEGLYILKSDEKLQEDIIVKKEDYEIGIENFTNIEKIEHYRKKCYELIDKQIQDLFSQGFIYNNILFSLSIEAQINWNSLYFYIKDIPLKQGFKLISTKDNSHYKLENTKIIDFINAYNNAKDSILQIGFTRKEKIKSINNINELIKILKGEYFG
jgi:hypothetical protein